MVEKKERELEGTITLDLQLDKLKAAQRSLVEATRYVERIEKEIERSSKKQTELQNQLEQLQAVASESSDDLQRKLQAIALVNKPQERMKLVTSFLMGIATSLIASFISNLI